MMTIAILPEQSGNYRAIAGSRESTGGTAGQALDALTAQLHEDETGTLVIVQNQQADRFFTRSQQKRLSALLALRAESSLSVAEDAELESLVEAELDGARERAETLLAELKP